MKKIPASFLALGLLSLAISSCSNEPEPPTVILQVEVDNTASGQPVIIDDITPVYYPPDLAEGQVEFEWENELYFPVPDYYGSELKTPWNPTARAAFNDHFRYDIRKADGWVLYISTFYPEIAVAVPILMLYNKYTGMMRTYFFTGSGTAGLEDYRILLNGAECDAGDALLAFTSDGAVDVDKETRLVMTLEPQPLADSTWYAFEYEMAFDKDVYSRDFTSAQLGSFFYMIKREKLSINEIELQNLRYKVRIEGSSYRYGDPYYGPARLILNDEADLDNASGLLSSSDQTTLVGAIENQNYDGLLNCSWYHAGSGEIQWPVLLDITSGPNAVGISNINVPISGADNSAIQGFGQFYSDALGVFYLDKKPVVTYTENQDASRAHRYILDASSVEYVFNPAVLESATIENIRQEVVATETEARWINGGRATIYTGQMLTSNLPLHIQGVRVSFDVVPKSGGKSVHITKLFLAHVEGQF